MSTSKSGGWPSHETAAASRARPCRCSDPGRLRSAAASAAGDWILGTVKKALIDFIQGMFLGLVLMACVILLVITALAFTK